MSMACRLKYEPRSAASSILILALEAARKGVAYYRDGPISTYFDSYGLDPPLEIVRYLGCSGRIQTFQLQGPDDVICGHLCLHVLRELAAGEKFEDIVLRLPS